jgi:hypothetical protein
LARNRSRRGEDAIEIAWTLMLWGGLAATLIVTWLAALGYWGGLTALRPGRLLGCLLLGSPAGWPAAVAGGVLHFLLGTVVFPAAYVAVFAWVDRADAGVGILAGLAHAFLAGAILPLLARRPRCSRSGAGDPGFFGYRYGPATPIGLLAAHLVYGGLLGYVYVIVPHP